MGKELTTKTPRDRMRHALELSLPVLREVVAKHVTPERLIRVAMIAGTRQPQLFDCPPATVIAAIVRAGDMGLEIGEGFGHAYLVPFKNQRTRRRECQLIVGYQGWIELALRTNKVLDVGGIPVFAGDEFDYSEGSKPFVHHKPNLKADRSAKTLEYVYGRAMVTGLEAPKLEVMTKTEVEAVRARAKAGDSGPWVSDYLMMARKSPIRRMAKYLPKTRELARAIETEEIGEGAYKDEVLDLIQQTLGEGAAPDEDAENAKADAELAAQEQGEEGGA